jgi:serine/threonine-protein kinase RIM15
MDNLPSEDASMIEETEDLRQAAEQSQRENVLVELTLDNVIRWVSSSWQDVIGYLFSLMSEIDLYRSDPKSVVGHSISEVLVGDQRVFDKATDIILADDAHSLRVRFNVAMGDVSHYGDQDDQGVFKLDDKLPEALEMEGQGILVRDDHSGNATHVCPQTRFRVNYRQCGSSDRTLDTIKPQRSILTMSL